MITGTSLRAVVPAAVAVLCAALAGCGRPDGVGSVSGKVTLGGQPLADAIVTFTPKTSGAPSSAITDASGGYTLQYTRDYDGALVGEHTVTISTYAAANPDAEPPKPEVPERVPARYNTKSELLATVESGSNTLDFPLESGGLIVQPAKGGDE